MFNVVFIYTRNMFEIYLLINEYTLQLKNNLQMNECAYNKRTLHAKQANKKETHLEAICTNQQPNTMPMYTRASN